MPFFPLAMQTNTPELWSHDQVQAMLAHDERLRQRLRNAQHDVDTARKELARVDARRFEAEQQVRLLQEQLAEREPVTNETW
jgi:phage shock protein A